MFVDLMFKQIVRNSILALKDNSDQEFNIKRLVVGVLDRHILRSILSVIGTLYARRFLSDARIIHNGEFWLHRDNGFWMVDGKKFEYTKGMLSDMGVEKSFRDVNDIWFYDYKPKTGDVIIDIGAGQGEDLLPMACAVGLTGRVVAIEAHPHSYKWLVTLATHNQLTQVCTINAAVMDKSGEVKIEDNDQWLGNRISENGVFTVTAVTLDELCADIQRIDFLKMNIEGAERLVIKNAKETMKRVRNVCISCHDFRSRRGDVGDFETRAEVMNFLIDNGFVIKMRDDDTRDYVRDYIYGHKITLP